MVFEGIYYQIDRLSSKNKEQRVKLIYNPGVTGGVQLKVIEAGIEAMKLALKKLKLKLSGKENEEIWVGPLTVFSAVPSTCVVYTTEIVGTIEQVREKLQVQGIDDITPHLVN